MPKPAVRSPFGSLLRQRRGFLPLFVGDLVSMSGASIFGSAINYLVYTTTNSALNVAYVGVAEFVPTILIGLFAGAFVDRSNQRRLMIFCDLVRGIVVAILPIYLIFLAQFSLPIIILVVIAVSVFSTVFRPAARTLMPKLVQREWIHHANGLMTAAESLANSISLAIGGLLIELVGATLTLFYNTGTYLISATMLILILVPSSRELVNTSNKIATPMITNDVLTVSGNGRGKKASLFSDVQEGMRYLRSNNAILEMILVSSVFNFFFTLVSNFWVVYETKFLLTSSGLIYGLLLSSFAFGQTSGALVSGRLNPLKHAGKVLISVNFVFGAAMLGLVLLRDAAFASSMLFVVGFGLGFSIAVYFSAIQTIVPSQFLGRVISADEVGSFATIPLAQIAGGLLIEFFGIVPDILIAGFGTLILAMITLFLKDLRRLKVNTQT